MKIAIVHDFLKYYGGAERVVEALHDIWPEAPVYTSFVDYKALGPHAERIKKWKIIESPFGSMWLMKKFHSPLRFMAPWVWNSFDFREFDVVISSSGWYISRGIVTQKPTVHICYLHHPPRHLYGYQTAMDWQKYWPVRLYGTIINHFLRMYDFKTAQTVDRFIANSEETKRRIEKFYRKDSVVIYPPVEINSQITNSNKQDPNNHQLTNYKLPVNYYLVVSRLARAKHINLAINACQQLGRNLVIVGKGREEEALKKLVKNYELRVTSIQSNIHFLGEVQDEELPFIYEHAQALIFPAEDEEFGIVPVEAMGCGIPVIAYRSGGVTETIIDKKTGLFFDALTIDSLKNRIKQCETMSFDKKFIRERAKEFSKEVFEKKIKMFVEQITG